MTFGRTIGLRFSQITSFILGQTLFRFPRRFLPIRSKREVKAIGATLMKVFIRNFENWLAAEYEPGVDGTPCATRHVSAWAPQLKKKRGC